MTGVSKGRLRTDEIRRFLLKAIADERSGLAVAAADRFGITRQAVNQHLRALTKRGLIRPLGSTRARRYMLEMQEDLMVYHITPDLKEHQVWSEFARPRLEGLPKNVLDICQYGFTEMLNNAIEHSEGSGVTVGVERTAVAVTLNVLDNGIGIFRKIRDRLDLEDEQHAVLELSKGKLTTDPKNHTGEGIFFASRAFEFFGIFSRGLSLVHLPSGTDWLLERKDQTQGTNIAMSIALDNERTLKSVFDHFSSTARPFSFSITHVPVSLAEVGPDNLVSRSQARRLVFRLDLFDEVLLDFSGVEAIGQAFADEVFRVFANAHPTLRLGWTGATPSVEAMIQRAVAERAAGPA